MEGVALAVNPADVAVVGKARLGSGALSDGG